MKLSHYVIQVRKMVDSQGFDKMLARYRSMGIVGADVVESDLAFDDLKGHARSIRGAGMEFGAFVETADIVTAEGKDLERNVNLVKGYIDELDRLGVPMIMLAPGVRSADSEEEFYAMREKMVESYGAMADYAEGSGVKVMIENQSVPQRADSYIRDCKYIIDRLPKVGFVLDSGNFFCVGDDVLKAYDVFRDRMVHSHIKDWEFHDYGRIIRSNMPPIRSSKMGQGLLPLDELLTRMKNDGYDGSIVLEINGLPFTSALMDQSTEYLLKFCD